MASQPDDPHFGKNPSQPPQYAPVERMPQPAPVSPYTGQSNAYASPQQPGYRPAEDIGQNAGMRMLLPVGRSAWAIIAGYLGLISVLLFPAPFAVLCGLVAVFDIHKSKDSPRPKHGLGRAIFGIIMGVLGTVGLSFALLGFLGAAGRRGW